MNNHHRSAVLAVGVLLAVSMATAQPPLEVEREFNIFTSQSAAGYFKPVLTTLQEGFASNIYHRASYAPQWSIGLDLSSPWMVIPESHKTFSAQLPDCYADPTAAQTAELRSGTLTRGISGAVQQPTYYGSIATPAFSVPQGTGESDFCRTVGFAEGHDIGIMPGLPNIQLIVGAPTRTELRIRAVPIPEGERSILYLGFGIAQQFDHWMNIFGDDKTMALAASTSLHLFDWSSTASATGVTAGIHYSKSWEGGFTVMGGTQFETISGDFTAVREPLDPSDAQVSAYEEIRRNAPITMPFESLNSFRLVAGGSYRAGIADFHLDMAVAAQPVLSGGITIWLAQWGLESAAPLDPSTIKP
ncbi:MAG: hypothetical protein DYG96_13585 [Chlorobi bacterium CHB2]|nr:hypothetical protein [Chlorobi bacterium CHB2]